jgi:hypothetical protein
MSLEELLWRVSVAALWIVVLIQQRRIRALEDNEIPDEEWGEEDDDGDA